MACHFWNDGIAVFRLLPPLKRVSRMVDAGVQEIARGFRAPHHTAGGVPGLAAEQLSSVVVDVFTVLKDRAHLCMVLHGCMLPCCRFRCEGSGNIPFCVPH
jgi:hypothetical protein